MSQFISHRLWKEVSDLLQFQFFSLAKTVFSLFACWKEVALFLSSIFWWFWLKSKNVFSHGLSVTLFVCMLFCLFVCLLVFLSIFSLSLSLFYAFWLFEMKSSQFGFRRWKRFFFWASHFYLLLQFFMVGSLFVCVEINLSSLKNYTVLQTNGIIFWQNFKHTKNIFNLFFNISIGKILHEIG